MVTEFVPEMRSDKKDAEIARLREQVQVLRTVCNSSLIWLASYKGGGALTCYEEVQAALAATEEK